jgi:hypothetical protein
MPRNTDQPAGAAESASPDLARQRLIEVRKALLHLHKTLLDHERTAYEQRYGQVAPGELLRLIINDRHFDWLHPVSELIVRIDELLDADPLAEARDMLSLLDQTRTLLRSDDADSVFRGRYRTVLQENPDAVLAHADTIRALDPRRSA